MNQPKIGDERPIENCPVCGGPQIEKYRSWPVYHNDTEEGWVSQEHVSLYQPNFIQCIKYLAGRIRELESK